MGPNFIDGKNMKGIIAGMGLIVLGALGMDAATCGAASEVEAAGAVATGAGSGVNAAGVAAAEERRVRCEFAFGDTVRSYSMYLPRELKEGAPLVVFTHGYGSNSRWKDGLNAVAEREGFAVCYPDGSPDSRGKQGWNVGYPSQYTMPDNEIEFFTALKREVCGRFRLSSDNCFMTGMSNGGDLCYQLAFTAPGLFRAYASVAGLLFEHVYLNNPLPQPVPFMEIHGDADTTSYWTGDHANKGGWGAYLPVELAVAELAVANRCTEISRSSFATLKDAERMVECTLYTGSPFGFDVRLYRIPGGKHSWGTGDVRTHELVWSFFAQYLKK